MSRRLPTSVKIPDKTVSQLEGGDRLKAWNLSCRLITPLFGGGHTTGEVDPVTPISTKGIRGQLRFWWRLLCGTTLENPTGLPATELLALREAELFGNTELPSSFDLRVAVTKQPSRPWRLLGQDREPPFEFEKFGSEMYALFPATQDRNDQVQQIRREGIEFSLTVRRLEVSRFARRADQEQKRRVDANVRRAKQRKSTLPGVWLDRAVMESQLQAAVWAWLNFGGIGSRTRRGVGAVTCDEERFSLLDSAGKLRYKIPGLTILTPCSSAKLTEVQCWAKSVDVYRQFRQGFRTRHPGRQKQTLRSRWNNQDRSFDFSVQSNRVESGRTEWPEPDSIRDITKTHLVGKTVVLPNGTTTFMQHDHAPIHHDKAFPRAALGLPVNFHFADGPVKGSPKLGIADAERDPGDVQIVPRVLGTDGRMRNGQRMSSPVITRPVLLNGVWQPAVILLRTPVLANLEAQLMRGKTPVSGGQISTPQIRDNCLKTLKVMHGTADALDALEAFLEKEFTRLPGEPS